ncbi:hypothetical protein [Halolamina rubra]|uniref:hypothetical protein n=1 Tax=Halolamina rubra TaxID=1380430 RepID=UPI000678C229|nr:hypothetical protein [Halolamina rubra]
MAKPSGAVASALVDRTALALFALLAGGWFLPVLYPPVAGTPVIVPPYLVVIVLYDGLLGLEHVAYAVAEMLPLTRGLAFDAGLLVTFYLFAVVVAALGRVLRSRLGPVTADGSDTRTLGQFGYAVAAGTLVIGLLLAAQGVVAQPTVTTESCTGQGSAAANGGSTTTATGTCTTTTEPATGQLLYIVSLGLGIAALGAGIVGVDRWLAGG